jgi:hypothetical protein
MKTQKLCSSYETSANTKVIIITADQQDRNRIYQFRYSIYGEELGQHGLNETGQLQDELDLYNQYIVAKKNDKVLGFISITPPSAPKFSIEKYFNRSSTPYQFDEYLYEIRLLSVNKNNRNGSLAFALMYAAFRWVQSHGGKYIVAICRAELIEMYCKAGLQPLGLRRHQVK